MSRKSWKKLNIIPEIRSVSRHSHCGNFYILQHIYDCLCAYPAVIIDDAYFFCSDMQIKKTQAERLGPFTTEPNLNQPLLPD